MVCLHCRRCIDVVVSCLLVTGRECLCTVHDGSMVCDDLLCVNAHLLYVRLGSAAKDLESLDFPRAPNSRIIISTHGVNKRRHDDLSLETVSILQADWSPPFEMMMATSGRRWLSDESLDAQDANSKKRVSFSQPSILQQSVPSYSGTPVLNTSSRSSWQPENWCTFDDDF